MICTLSAQKALLLLAWIFVSIGSINGEEIIRKFADMLQTLDSYINPYMKSPQTIKFRESDNTIVDFITKKIEELQPLLNDNDTIPIDLNSFNKTAVAAEDDTRILESDPNSNRKSLIDQAKNKKDMQRYRQLRKRIKKALKIEKVSEETRRMITNAIDDMLGHILENQCNLKSLGDPLRRHGATKDSNGLTLSGVWDLLWKRLKAKNKKGNEIFLQHFQDFVTKILRDTEDLSSQYTIVCQLKENADKDSSVKEKNNDLVEENKNLFMSEIGKPASHMERVPLEKEINERKKSKIPSHLKPDLPLRSSDTFGENETCSNFRVCSNELQEFMVDFYNNLKDITTATFNNYAEMFSRDVREDSRNEKQIVITQVRLVAKKLEPKIKEIFQKQTRKFKLDENKSKQVNYNNIKLYIKKCVGHIKKQAMSTLNVNINDLRSKLRTNVEKDIAVNLNGDLGNFEKELNDKICTIFQVCNGKTLTRRRGTVDEPNGVDKNSLVVKVQISFDDLSNGIKQIGQVLRGKNLGQWRPTISSFRYGSYKSPRSIQFYSPNEKLK